MAQFGQTQMSSKQPSYLDVLRQKEEVKPKFNLFDFSSVKTQQPIQTKQMNFGAPMSGKNITNFSDYKQTIPQQTQPTQKSGFSLIPTANAMEQEDLLQQYLKDPKQDNNSKQQLFQALQDGESPDSIINYLQTSGYKGNQPTQAPGLLESIKYTPYKKEEVTDFDPNKSTARNLLEGQGKYASNIAGGVYNVIPGLAQLATGVIEGTGKDMYNKIGGLFGMDTTEYDKTQAEKTGNLAKAVFQDYAKTYGSSEGFTQKLMEDPTAIVGDVLTVFGVGAAGKSKLNTKQLTNLEKQKAITVANVKNATTLEQKSAFIKQGIEQAKQIVSKQEQVKNAQDLMKASFKYDPYTAVPTLAVKGVVGGTKLAGKAAVGTTEYATKQLTGLDQETQQFIKNSPELFNKIKNGEITAEQVANDVKIRIEARLEGLKETGKGYEEIKKGTQTFEKQGIQDIYNETLNKEGITSKGYTELPLGDRQALEQAQRYLDEYTNTNLTTKEAIELKAKLNDLVSYDKPTTAQGERIVKGIIKNIDNKLKETIPGYKELDEVYGPEREFLNKVRKDILNKDGTLKDNAISIIRNLAGKGKEFKIARLEAIMPGITEKVKGIKAFEDIKNSELKVGNYVKGGLVGGVVGTSTGVIPGVAIFLLTHPAVASKILLGYGLTKQFVKNIFTKTKNKVKLSPDEAIKVNEAIRNTPVEKVLEGDNLSMNNPKLKDLEKKQYIAYNKFKEDNKDFFNKRKDLENKILEEQMKGYDDYNYLAGETEARNVQTRLNKTPDERKLLRPAKTEDVARDKQIVKMEGGKSMLTNSKQVSKSDDLISEAKKYKSADEFENAFTYHGTHPTFINRIQKEGLLVDKGHSFTSATGNEKYIFHTQSKKYAKAYGDMKSGGNGVVLVFKKPKDSRIDTGNQSKKSKYPDLITKQNIKPEDLYIYGKDNKLYPLKEYNNYYGEKDSFIGKNGFIDFKQIYEQANKPKLLKK